MDDKKLKVIDEVEMGGRIRRKREFLNMSRKEVADLMGICPKTLYYVENGEKGLSLKNLYKISQILDLSCDYILAGVESKSDCDEGRQLIQQEILEPLKYCTLNQLTYIEDITRIFVKALKEGK